jgi:hypothetical protein
LSNNRVYSKFARVIRNGTWKFWIFALFMFHTL